MMLAKPCFDVGFGELDGLPPAVFGLHDRKEGIALDADYSGLGIGIVLDFEPDVARLSMM